MMFWWKLLFGLFFIFLKCEVCSASPLDQRNSTYMNSLRLTRSTRACVQQLLRRYKDYHLGDRHFEDRSLQLNGLPLLSTDFNSWLKIEDWERLHAAYQDLRTYWGVLDLKSKQLQKGTYRIQYIQRNLRDLITHVHNQMRLIDSSRAAPALPIVPGKLGLGAMLPSQTLWDSHLEGYIILRDVDLYLTKLARDFLLLLHRNHHDPGTAHPKNTHPHTHKTHIRTSRNTD